MALRSLLKLINFLVLYLSFQLWTTNLLFRNLTPNLHVFRQLFILKRHSSVKLLDLLFWQASRLLHVEPIEIDCACHDRSKYQPHPPFSSWVKIGCRDDYKEITCPIDDGTERGLSIITSLCDVDPRNGSHSKLEANHDDYDAYDSHIRPSYIK